jgi:hypothetical protein
MTRDFFLYPIKMRRVFVAAEVAGGVNEGLPHFFGLFRHLPIQVVDTCREDTASCDLLLYGGRVSSTYRHDHLNAGDVHSLLTVLRISDLVRRPRECHLRLLELCHASNGNRAHLRR